MNRKRTVRLILLVLIASGLAILTFIDFSSPDSQTRSTAGEQAVALLQDSRLDGLILFSDHNPEGYEIQNLSSSPELVDFSSELIDPMLLRNFLQLLLNLRGLPRPDLTYEGTSSFFIQPILRVELYTKQNIRNDSVSDRLTQVIEFGPLDASGDTRLARLEERLYQIPESLVQRLIRFPETVLVRQKAVFDPTLVHGIRLTPQSNQEELSGQEELFLVRSEQEPRSKRFSQFFPFSVVSSFSRPMPVNPEILELIEPLFSGVLQFGSRLATLESLDAELGSFRWSIVAHDTQGNEIWQGDLIHVQGVSYYNHGDRYIQVQLEPILYRGFDLITPFVYLQGIERVQELRFVYRDLLVELTGGGPLVRRSTVNDQVLNSEQTALVYREILGLMYQDSVIPPNPGQVVGSLNIRDSDGVFDLEFFVDPNRPTSYVLVDSLGGIFSISRAVMTQLVSTIQSIANSQ